MSFIQEVDSYLRKGQPLFECSAVILLFRKFKWHNVINFEFAIRLLTRWAKDDNAINFELGLFDTLTSKIAVKSRSNQINLQLVQYWQKVILFVHSSKQLLWPFLGLKVFRCQVLTQKVLILSNFLTTGFLIAKNSADRAKCLISIVAEFDTIDGLSINGTKFLHE